MTCHTKSRRVSILIGCLFLIAALSAIWPAYRAFLNIEIDENEGWNAYFADAAMGRMALYPSRDLLITNNYPPLSFYITGGLGRLIGDPILAGRLLSLVAVAVIAAGVALMVKRLGGGTLEACIGAAYFVATMCRFFSSYTGTNDPHLLAQAIMTLCFAAFGENFLFNFTSPRIFHLGHSIGAVGHLQWVAVGLVIWLYVGWTRRADPGVRICNLLIGLGLLLFFIQKSGDGVAHNAQFELVFGVSIGVGLAFAQAPLLPPARSFPTDTLRFAGLLAICLRLVLSTRVELVRLLADASFHTEIANREAAMAATVSRIKMIPGDVLCDPFASYRAGKPFVVDYFNCGQRMRAGKLPSDAISKLVASGKLTAVQTDPLLSWSNLPDAGQIH